LNSEEADNNQKKNLDVEQQANAAKLWDWKQWRREKQ